MQQKNLPPIYFLFSLATALQKEGIAHITGSVKGATGAAGLNSEGSMLLFQEAVLENSLLCVENIYVLETALLEIRAEELHGYTFYPCPATIFPVTEREENRRGCFFD